MTYEKFQYWWAMPLKERDELIVFKSRSSQETICFLNFYFKGRAFDCCKMVDSSFELYENSRINYSTMFSEYIADNFKESKKYIPAAGSLISGRPYAMDIDVKPSRKRG